MRAHTPAAAAAIRRHLVELAAHGLRISTHYNQNHIIVVVIVVVIMIVVVVVVVVIIIFVIIIIIIIVITSSSSPTQPISPSSPAH